MTAPEKVPHQTCGCMSGLTDRQVVLAELGGMMDMFQWKVSQARSAFEMQTMPGDKEALDYLLKAERGLANLKAWAAAKAWVKP